MRVAIATDQFRQISLHAGRSRHWLLYADGADEPIRIELAPEQIFHLHPEGPHPLDGIELAIARHSGDGFRRHMAERGISLLLTRERDPQQAIVAYRAGRLPPPAPPGLLGVFCKIHDALFSRHAREH